jgi:5-methylcytosine-specific restriction enzyme subunit McrC
MTAGEDMYQLYAYGTKYQNCKKLFLVYPKDNEIENSYYKFFDDLHLKIYFFDFDGENEELEKEINSGCTMNFFIKSRNRV